MLNRLYSVLILLSLFCHQGIDCKKSPFDKSTGQHKSVKVLLNSKWSQTPLYLEVAEYLSEENGDYFWSYLNQLSKEVVGDNFQNLTQLDQYELSIRLAEKQLRSQAKLDILKFSLSLRYNSPKVTIFDQVANDIVLHNSKQLENCDSFVELSYPDLNVASDFIRYSCQLEDLKKSIDFLIKQSPSNLFHPRLYSVDHIYPTSLLIDNPITVILYGSAGTERFFKLHNFLRQQSVENHFRYVVRYYYPTVDSTKVALSGYGVELAIKSTEYKAQDDTRVRGEAVVQKEKVVQESEQKPDEISGFVFSKLKENHQNLVEKLDDFRNYLIDNEKEIATLKVWELQEISLQAVTKIMSVQKDQALTMLKDISQNFPSVARSLVKINVEDDLKREIIKNQHLFMQSLNLGTGDTALFVNGIYNDVDTVDFFPLFDLIKQEYGTVNKLYSLLGGDNDRIRRFVKLDINWEKQDFQLDIRDGSVQYINDIEKDKMYRNWPSSLQDFLRPTYPGMLRNVRRNMYHLVLVIDPSKKESFDILRMAESFYIHKAPVRIGLVFAVNVDENLTGFQDAGVACLEAFNYISQEKSAYDALSFLTDVIAYATSGSSTRDLEASDVVNNFKSKFSQHGADVDDVFGSDSAYDSGRKLAWDFIHRTGLERAPKALLNGVLLKEAFLTADQFEDAVLTEVMKQTTPFQKAIYKGELADSDDILDWIMKQKTVMPRLNRIIFGTGPDVPKSRYLDLTIGTAIKATDSNYHTVNIDDLQATLVSTIKYINSKKDCNPVTVWLASDFNTVASLNLLKDSLEHIYSSSKSMRLAFIFADFNPLTQFMSAALGSITGSQQTLQFMRKFVRLALTDQNVPEFKDVIALVPEDSKEKFTSLYDSVVDEKSGVFPLHKAFSSRVLNLVGLDLDHFSLVLNGKVFKIPLKNPNGLATFVEQDFSLMERFVTNMVSDKIVDLLSNEEQNAGVRKCSDFVLKISSTLLAKTNSNTKQRYDVNNVKEDHSVLVLDPRFEDKPYVELTVMLDPLSRGAQKISPILEVFHQVFNLKIKIYFNCVDKHSDMPLKLFYRFVLETEPKFDSTTGALIQPIAHFQSMPKTPLLTLGMSVPENWLVEAVEAIHDLDNIHLEEVSTHTVNAIFELEHLLVEGHCFEQSTGNPPRGLQFTLGTQNNPVMVDTIVMANLGYFQLKANPGIWTLRLRQGRSDDIYTIVSHDGTDQTGNNTEIIPVVSGFRSLVIKIRVNKKSGKQNEELLYDSENDKDDGSNSLWDSWNWGGSKTDSKEASAPTQSEDEDSNRINIFSLASGHLYERLLRIMMISVLKNTKTPVKFWFLKNYLSPNFKNVLPFMSKRYGFEYELVEYKWPRWLHQQTEKQRIIWGYKILFLDVLFPLDVKKIIFVDADQVVRADLKELRDFDLEGAPYGYTPFCDSRHDMDGFRFWKSGYWATHLHGRKYHISALYVVDLQKFRRIAAGDRLRGQYQMLSQDPNSLSNLDQDLPNNMIHQVSIKSLPNEWLWCETWCDDESKKKAKTIDLCNNPKTKEPKLTSARRIIAEWEDYDRELRKMLTDFEQIGTEPGKTTKDVKQSHQEL